jgi:hypothetical protein
MELSCSVDTVLYLYDKEDANLCPILHLNILTPVGFSRTGGYIIWRKWAKVGGPMVQDNSV